MIEVLIAVAIIAIFAVILLPSLTKMSVDGKKLRMSSMSLTALGKPAAGTALSPPWATEQTTFEEAYQRVRTILNEAQIDDSLFGLYLINPTGEDQGINPNYSGFMVITAPERIDASGNHGGDRWNLERKAPKHDGLYEQFLWLFGNAPKEGRFRFFVIAFTGEPPITNAVPPRWAESSKWYQNAGSYAHLPEAIRDLQIGHARMHVYVYLYERERLETSPHSADEGPHSIMMHLERAGADRLLRKPQL